MRDKIGTKSMQQMSNSTTGTVTRQSRWQVDRLHYRKLMIYSALVGGFCVAIFFDTMMGTRATLLSLLAPTALCRSLGSRQSGSPPTVEIGNGTVQGVYQPTYNQDLFLGQSRPNDVLCG